MKVALLCPRSVPPTIGGAEQLWSGLASAIERLRGHRAELIWVDSPERSVGEVIRSYDHFNRLTLDDYDVVITGKYPAWMIRHPRHVVYMCHPFAGSTMVIPVTRRSIRASCRSTVAVSSR